MMRTRSANPAAKYAGQLFAEPLDADGGADGGAEEAIARVLAITRRGIAEVRGKEMVEMDMGRAATFGEMDLRLLADQLQIVANATVSPSGRAARVKKVVGAFEDRLAGTAGAAKKALAADPAARFV